ncbi:MAG: Ig-like domain-containing protein [Actinobacteria bacterium]|nr:Ig-like domain-containing protein [Actinomycetota bacterium]
MGILVLAATLALPVTTTQAAPLPAESTTVAAASKLQNGDISVYGTPVAVTPDTAYTNEDGNRVEVYTSAGDNDGVKADWRSVNEFAYLVNSVPKGKNLYATVFNALYDYGTAKADATTGDYSIVNSSGSVIADTGLFRPTIAFRNQINQYDSLAEAKTYVHVLGAKQSMEEAYKAPSSLARLLKASGVMKYCSKTSTGACLTSSNVDPDSLMHSKYALFEQSKDSTGKVWDDVIWITSANLNGSSGGKKSNTSIAIYGDSAGYDGLLNSVWNAQLAQTQTTAYKAAAANGVAADDSDFTFYPSPRSKDFEATTLATVAAIAGKTNCKAYLAHSLFNSARVALLNQLAALQTQGCTVKIALGDNAIADTVDAYFGMSQDAREVINRVEFGNVHDKAITVSYTASGTTHGVTYGGSANANGTSLDHDELAFKAESLTVTRAVELQLERVYELSRGGKTNVQVSGLTIDPATVAINVGSSRTLQPRITPTSASVKTVTWASSDSSVVSVDAVTGKITAKKVSATPVAITATSLSGNRTATSAITVSSDQTETGEATASTNVINVPPTLTMDRYQQTVSSTGDDRQTEAVVTWGTGATEITGTVALQYYDAGSWKTKTNISVTNGRGTKMLDLKSSRAWRLAAKTPSGAKLGSDAKYSAGYSYNVVKTKENTTTPRLYAPTMVKSGAMAPFFVTWKGASGKLRLQYLAGSGWKTKVTFTIDGGGTQKFISAPVGSTRKWRIATSTKRSSSITVKVLS